MNEKEIRKIVREKILERFQKNLDAMKESESGSDLPVLSEKDLTLIINKKLKESLVRTSKK